jgi:hypothetical protein
MLNEPAHQQLVDEQQLHYQRQYEQFTNLLDGIPQVLEAQNAEMLVEAILQVAMKLFMLNGIQLLTPTLMELENLVILLMLTLMAHGKRQRQFELKITELEKR